MTIKYQIERTVREIVEGQEKYTTTVSEKPTSDLKLAKARVALQCMKDERLGIAASYKIIKVTVE